MLAALTFSGLLSLTSALGLEDQVDLTFACTSPAFFVTRAENQLTGDKHLELKGTIQAPQQGFKYSFQFATVEAPYAYAIIQVAQVVTSASPTGAPYGRGLPSIQTISVLEKFNVPQEVTTLKIRIQGLGPQPQEIACDLTRPIQTAPVN